MSNYVLVWPQTDPPSLKFKTYVHPKQRNRPISAPLDAFSPTPTIVINSPAEADAYFTNPSTTPAAIDETVIRDLLGWDPIQAKNV